MSEDTDILVVKGCSVHFWVNGRCHIRGGLTAIVLSRRGDLMVVGSFDYIPSLTGGTSKLYSTCLYRILSPYRRKRIVEPGTEYLRALKVMSW